MDKECALSEARRVVSNFQKFCSDIGITAEYYGVVMGIAMSVWRKPLINLIRESRKARKSVHFLGRDMDVIYFALRSAGAGRWCGYVRGCNRTNTRRLELQNNGALRRFVMNQGVRPGDVLVDSGFRGSIPSAINNEIPVSAYLLTGDSRWPVVDKDLNTLQHRDLILRFEHAPKYEISYWESVQRSFGVSEYANYDPCVPELETPYYAYRDGFTRSFLQDWSAEEVDLATRAIIYWPDFEVYDDEQSEQYKRQPGPPAAELTFLPSLIC